MICYGWMSTTELVCDHCFTIREDGWKMGRDDVAPRQDDNQWMINSDCQAEISEAHCQNKYCKELVDRYVHL